MAFFTPDISAELDRSWLMYQQYGTGLGEPSAPQQNMLSMADVLVDDHCFIHNSTASAPSVDCIFQQKLRKSNRLSTSPALNTEYLGHFVEGAAAQFPPTNDDQYLFSKNDRSLLKQKVDLDLYPSHQHQGIHLEEGSHGFENSSVQSLFSQPFFERTGYRIQDDDHSSYHKYDISSDPRRSLHAYPLPQQNHQLQQHYCNKAATLEQQFCYSFGGVADCNIPHPLHSCLAPSPLRKGTDSSLGSDSLNSRSPTTTLSSSMHSDLSTDFALISTSSSLEGVTNDICSPLKDPFQTSWWTELEFDLQTSSASANSQSGVGVSPQSKLGGSHEGSLMSPQSWIADPSLPAQSHRLDCAIPSTPRTPARFSSSNPPGPPCKPRKFERRSLLPSKMVSRSMSAQGDDGRASKKTSRGRRPLILPELGLATLVGQSAVGLQLVRGGKAFDPSLNPHADSVKHCEVTKTGKRKKIFICQAEGCGKCFKRSEHLRRHVRSIHTNLKPYDCPWPTCTKSFSRHDNLNQHLRVHRAEPLGQLLDGLHVGSDGMLRASKDETIGHPVSRGLKTLRYLAD